MKIFSITPKDDNGEVIYTTNQQQAVDCLNEGQEVKMADCFFHPVELQLSLVRSKIDKEVAE